MSAEVIPGQTTQRRAATALSATAMMIAVVVLYGWFTDNRSLIEMSQSVAMVVNTAVSLLLTGFAIALLACKSYKAALVCGLLVCILGGLTGLQYLTGISFGIDTLLYDPGSLIESPLPGRMSPATAGCALLSGLSISVLALPGRLRYEGYLAGAFGAAVLAIGAASGAAYSLSIRSVYEWVAYPGMAQLTATGFALLGAALLVMSWGRVDTKTEGWRFSLLALAAALITLNGLIWAAFQSANVERGQKFIEVQMATLDQGVVERIDLVVDSLEKMSRRLRAASEPTVGAWSARVQGFIDANPAVLAIAMVAADGAVSRSERQERLGPIDWDSVLAEFRTQWAQSATAGGLSGPSKTQVVPWTGSDQLRQGLKVEVTFERPENGIQHMVALVDLDSLLGSFVRRQGAAFSQVQIEMSGATILSAAFGAVEASQPIITSQRPILDRTLIFNAMLAPDPIPYRSILSTVVLAMGLGLSALLLFALDLLIRARQQSGRLADHDRFLWQVFDSAPNALILVNAQGRIEMANEHSLVLFGYSRGELRERNIEDLMPDRLRESHKGLRADFLSRPSSRDMGDGRELLGRRRDGREFPVEVGLRPVYRADGLRVLASVVDVTEHRRIISELTRSNEELDRFAYIASHDLKSPLRAIDQLATWLADDLGESLTEESSRHLELMRSRVGRMERLLSDLLDYSRIGREASKPEWIDLEALIRNCFAMYNADERFQLNLEGRMPGLKSVRTSLEMIFRNLLGNSIKHHDRPAGEITVRVSKSGPMVLFEFADDGPGVPEQYAERAFEMFSTLRPRDEIEGSGMGLAIVKKTIDALGGTISMQVNKPRGLLVRFTILDTATVAKSAASDATASAL